MEPDSNTLRPGPPPIPGDQSGLDMPTAVPDAADEDNTREKIGVARASGIIALGNITSRVLGLVREIILSHLFGAGIAVDAFKIAIIVPRSLYDLLIGGHVNSALIPVMSDYANRQDRRELWELVNALLGIVLIGLLGLVLTLELLAEPIVRLVASEEASSQTLREATDLLRITAPALLFLSLFAVLSGLLYALKRFTLPAFGASVFNLMIVTITLLFADEIGITAAALGWLVGAVVQVGIQLPQLRHARILPRFRGVLKHPGVRTIGLLYAPVMFSLSLDVLINRPFSYNLASRTGEGNISYMDWATTLIQFPHGLVATAISIAVLPTLSQQASASKETNLGAYKDTLSFGLRLATVLILPATVGLMVLATPVVALIFEHGAFTASDTEVTTQALRLYLVGLPFATIDLLLVFAFYARQDTVTPALIGLLALIAYMITAVALLPYVGFLSLMIADSVKHILHSSISGWLLWRRVGGLRGQALLTTGIKTLAAALVMGAFTAAALYGLSQIVSAATLPGELIHVIGAGGSGVAVFLAAGYWLRIRELHWAIGFFRQRLTRT
ncbi:MAG: murein biosynthesis integral membrane protein MurJ [Chloroflexi bacterium]|nr:murein biosynthesis integral membrane protein MurJ [Chloroflexota bacterium]